MYAPVLFSFGGMKLQIKMILALIVSFHSVVDQHIYCVGFIFHE